MKPAVILFGFLLRMVTGSVDVHISSLRPATIGGKAQKNHASFLEPLNSKAAPFNIPRDPLLIHDEKNPLQILKPLLLTKSTKLLVRKPVLSKKRNKFQFEKPRTHKQQIEFLNALRAPGESMREGLGKNSYNRKKEAHNSVLRDSNRGRSVLPKKRNKFQFEKPSTHKQQIEFLNALRAPGESMRVVLGKDSYNRKKEAHNSVLGIRIEGVNMLNRTTGVAQQELRELEIQRRPVPKDSKRVKFSNQTN